jgi:putative membrane protein
VRNAPKWWTEGEQPDYRFSLANERTFLAWIRTALALLAGSIAVVQLVPRFSVAGARTVLGVVLALVGGLLALAAYRRWSANERAMREARPLPYTPVLIIAAIAVSAVAVLVLVLVLADAA